MTARSAPERSRLASLATVLVFDVAGPLAAYYVLRAEDLSAVVALILSGVLPALGIVLSVARSRRLDAIGAVVLTGIAVGTLAGVLSGSAHLVLLDGLVPTAVFGIACLASLRSSRPLIFRFTLEGIGEETAKGREFADLWRYDAFRRAFRFMTIVWGVAFLVEVALQAAIIETAPVGVAKATSNLLPIAVAGIVAVWNVVYGTIGKRHGDQEV